MQTVVGVQYKSATKTYYFSPEGKEYKLGQMVVVDTANGQAVGTIVVANKEVDDKEIESPLKPVLRVMTEKDQKQLAKIKEHAKNVIPKIEEKISLLKLPMKVVDAEYSFDETRITIFFTSDNRVDFRELLKHLASMLKVKIELRQIGLREEVKTIGGLGLCGRPCCCTTFLQEPAHITVKMVKLQNLSMNPTKVGGLCGRMMCCLSYEDETYKKSFEKMPKVGSEVITPDGKGTVQFNDLLKEITTVKIVNANESFIYRDYSYKDLKFEGKIEEIEEIEEIEDIEEEKNGNISDILIQEELVKEKVLFEDKSKNIDSKPKNEKADQKNTQNKNQVHNQNEALFQDKKTSHDENLNSSENLKKGNKFNKDFKKRKSDFRKTESNNVDQKIEKNILQEKDKDSEQKNQNDQILNQRDFKENKTEKQKTYNKNFKKHFYNNKNKTNKNHNHNNNNNKNNANKENE